MVQLVVQSDYPDSDNPNWVGLRVRIRFCILAPLHPPSSMLLSPTQHLRLPPADRFRRRPAAVARRIPGFAIRANALSSKDAPAPTSRETHYIHLSQSSSSPMDVTLGCRRDAELGLASVLFVISMVLGSLFSLFVISLPTLYVFRKLAASSAKLSKVVSEEVPGTLFSLKLSGLEISDLTCQLNNLKRRILGDRYVKKGSNNIPGFR